MSVFPKVFQLLVDKTKVVDLKTPINHFIVFCVHSIVSSGQMFDEKQICVCIISVLYLPALHFYNNLRVFTV